MTPKTRKRRRAEKLITHMKPVIRLRKGSNAERLEWKGGRLTVYFHGGGHITLPRGMKQRLDRALVRERLRRKPRF